jgi:hypothetical protein
VDLVSGDPLRAGWSERQLTLAAAQDELAIIYAELAVRDDTIEALEAMIRDARLAIAAIPRPARFIAGKAFQRYRFGGGVCGPGWCPNSLSAPMR